MRKRDIIVTFWPFPRSGPSLVATSGTAVLEISRKVQEWPEGEMDPNMAILEILSELDKRHAFKADLGFSRSEPVLNSSGFNGFPGTLLEA